jgi:hypothetical protein
VLYHDIFECNLFGECALVDCKHHLLRHGVNALIDTLSLKGPSEFGQY